MPLILRKCQKNGLSSNNFYYGNVGDIVTCPDWNPEPKCGNGLHGLLEGNGDWGLLYGDDWLVIEANESDIVKIDECKCKFHTGKILFRGSKEQLANSEFPAKFENLNSKSAFNWGRDIGNHDVMMHKITESEWAYFWAKYIGNHDIMMHKITDPYWAYYWGRDIGNHDIMMHKITDPLWAYYWAKNIGNHDVMMHKITNSKYAYWWAKNIGNHDVMINKINEPHSAYFWAKCIGNHDVIKPKVTDHYYIERWNETFPNNPINT